MKLEEAFAKNLKSFRKKQNITQMELSKLIGCSEKAVSKWECGLSIPDIEILFSLAGIAGGTSADMNRILTEFFDGFGFLSFKIDTDNKNIIAAGLGDRDGITLILGTCICSFLQKGGVHSYVGGSGYLIDDGGSGYNIGRDGLSAYYRSMDGIVQPTAITRIMDETLDCTPREILGRVYSEGKRFIASLSRVVYEAAKIGDKVAVDIIKRNMSEAATFVLANAKKLDVTPVPLVVAGGLTNEEMTLQYLKEALNGEFEFEFEITLLDCAPVHGAVKLAKKLYEEEKGE